MAQFNSYPQKATPIAADTVLIYDSAGAVLKQVPIKNLFENYAGTSLGGSAQTVKSAIDALNSKLSLQTYSSDGLMIYRVGRSAQLAALPAVVTTSSNAVVATIPAGAFRPASRVWFATKVYNGSAYVDCFIELATNGEISLKSNSGAIVSGYQANYVQCLGMNFLCNGS